MRLKRSALIVTALCLGQNANAFYSCYDYCNPGAVTMIKQAYPLAAHRMSILGPGRSIFGSIMELQDQQNNQINGGRLDLSLSEANNKSEEQLTNSELLSLAEIVKRKTIAEEQIDLKRAYPNTEQKTTLDANGYEVSVDTINKEPDKDEAPLPETTGTGAVINTSTKGNDEPKDANHGNTVQKFDPGGSPEENERALFDIFDRLKLSIAGPKAVGYVNPLTSRNFGSQPNEIYTIYNRAVKAHPETEEFTLDTDKNPTTAPSIYQVWAQSPLIEPTEIDQIFLRHYIDIEIFKQFKNYVEVVDKFKDAIGGDSEGIITNTVLEDGQSAYVDDTISANGETAILTLGEPLGGSSDQERQAISTAISKLKNSGFRIVVLLPNSALPHHHYRRFASNARKAAKEAGVEVISGGFKSGSDQLSNSSVQAILAQTRAVIAYGGTNALLLNKALGHMTTDQISKDQTGKLTATFGANINDISGNVISMSRKAPPAATQQNPDNGTPNTGAETVVDNGNGTTTPETGGAASTETTGNATASSETQNFSISNEHVGKFAPTRCVWTANAEKRASSVQSLNRGLSNRDIGVYYAEQKHYPAPLILGQIMAESGFNPNATSSKDAVGMVQFTLATSQNPGPWHHENRRDPHQNVPAAIEYMSWILREKSNNDIVDAIARYNRGPYSKPEKLFAAKETRTYIPRLLCYAKLFELYGPKPPIGATTTFDSRTDLDLFSKMGFSTKSGEGVYPMSGTQKLGLKDEYGIERYGIFVENANTYRNVTRTEMSELFAWMMLQYNSGITDELLGKAFTDTKNNKAPTGIEDNTLEATSSTLISDKTKKLGIGAATVSKTGSADKKGDKSSAQAVIKRGAAFNERLVNNYAQYLSSYWFDPIFVPNQLYIDTDTLEAEQLNEYYKLVRRNLELEGSPNRIGPDRVPLKVLKALILNNEDARAINDAYKAATGKKSPVNLENVTNDFFRSWVAEATLAEVQQSVVKSTLVDQLDFRIKPDKNAWPSYNFMAQYISENPDQIGEAISPNLALDMALFAAYNPYKYGLSPAEAIDSKSYYSHKFYPFIRYFGDMTTPVGEEPNRITPQVVLDKTISYIHDPKFFEMSELASGDDLIRQIPKFAGLETYVSYRRLQEAKNKRKMLMSWASSSTGMGRTYDSSGKETKGFERTSGAIAGQSLGAAQ